MALFLLKKRTQDKITEQAGNLKNILDTLDAWVYVIDPNTYELKFLNKKTRTLAPDSRVGMTCYSTFMARLSPCPDCPLTAEDHACIIENAKLGVRVQSQATQIFWDNKEEALITCYDIGKETL